VAKAATKTTTRKAPAQKGAVSKTAGKTSSKTTKAPAKATASKAAPSKTAATKAAASKSTASKAVVKTAARAVKKPAKASATAASPILTLRQIAEALAETHELPKRQANAMLVQVVELITRSLKKGEKIRLTGLGILQVRKRAARMGRNPQTGEPVKIKASKKIAFRPAKDLKEAI
jgi:Bacterial nucleoid DNA-binding protein